MERKILAARLRQLQAVDMNALAIYTDLSTLAKDDGQRKIFSHIAEDERRHVDLGKKLLSLLEK